MHSYEKAVKSATKQKLAPPKAKYVDHILSATRTGEAGVAEVFRTLQFRLRDPSWTIALKALIIVHLMIREGQPEVTLQYLAMDYRKVMAFSTYSDVQTQGRNIKAYSTYLIERARSYSKTKQDYVEGSTGRLKKLSVDRGLLREVESVQEVMTSLVKCDFFAVEPENDVTLSAFRLCLTDLLKLFQVMNEGTITVLEHYFEMSKPDAERALSIYKMFAGLTERVMKFLAEARAYETSTRIEIPRIHHAPLSLATHLEEYLTDPDFDVNRRQYLATQDAKRTGKPLPSVNKAPEKSNAVSSKPTFPDAAPTQTVQSGTSPAKGPSPDLIDFFESIEQNQQPMAQNPAQFQQQAFQPQFTGAPQQIPQQTGLNGYQQSQPTIQPSTTNPFNQYQQQHMTQQQIQSQPTGVGFGAYVPQPQQPVPTGFPQNGMFNQAQQEPQQLQRQSTNPFRQSMMPQMTSHMTNGMQSPPPPMPQLPQQTGTNPFAQQSQAPGSSQFQQFMQQSQLPFSSVLQQQAQTSAQPLLQQRTGTNPFARASPANNNSPSQPPGALVSQATGSTNPFRQSEFVNSQSGMGWQVQQGTMGGLENLETKPVFPRPGQTPQNQSAW